MEYYRNLNGDSGVAGFNLGNDSITVYFKDGAAYLYTYGSAGAGNIEQMKKLALTGSGLNTYINKYVRKLYAAKVR